VLWYVIKPHSEVGEELDTPVAISREGRNLLRKGSSCNREGANAIDRKLDEEEAALLTCSGNTCEVNPWLGRGS
jgi:hypothetical protein